MDRLPVSLPSVKTLARETIYIPAHGESGHLARGVIQLVSIIIHPDDERRQRLLASAFQSWAARDLIPQGKARKRLPKRVMQRPIANVRNTINRGIYLLNRRRHPAAQMLSWLLPQGWPGIPLKIKPGGFGPGHRVIDLRDAIWSMANVHRAQGRQSFQEPKITKLYDWDTSRSVVHLCLPVMAIAESYDITGDTPIDIFKLIYNPEWLPGALQYAEALRINLSKLDTNINSAETIQVLPDPTE